MAPLSVSRVRNFYRLLSALAVRGKWQVGDLPHDGRSTICSPLQSSMQAKGLLHMPCKPLTCCWLRGRLVSLLLLLQSALWAQTAESPSLEYQVKAAFLLNYTKFTEWPSAAFAGPGAPISICVLADPGLDRALEQMIEGEIVAGRRVISQRIKQGPAPKSCQVLFLSSSSREDAAILASVGLGVLTVGEGESFLREGGMVAFVIENRRVRFDINQTAAEKAGLKLSSRLLSVARSVEK
jgi:YfiR/HmsC-like